MPPVSTISKNCLRAFAVKSANVWLVWQFDVAQIVNLPYRGLAIRRRPKRETAADCQSAKQQTSSLRYVGCFFAVLPLVG
jgi:hypothetical protein